MRNSPEIVHFETWAWSWSWTKKGLVITGPSSSLYFVFSSVCMFQQYLHKLDMMYQTFNNTSQQKSRFVLSNFALLW